MCLGVPGLVVERGGPAIDGGMPWAVVEFDGLRRKVCIACVPESRPGDYVIVHAGLAISRVDPAEAARIFAMLDEAGERDEWHAPATEAEGGGPGP